MDQSSTVAMVQSFLRELPGVIETAAALGGIRAPAVFETPQPNAYADLQRHAIYINPSWLAEQGARFGRFNWSAQEHWSFVVGVVGHEIGHLVHRTYPGHAAEHLADCFAAHLLARLGLDHEPFSLWLFTTRGGATHPDGLARMSYHQRQWALERFFPEA